MFFNKRLGMLLTIAFAVFPSAAFGFQSGSGTNNIVSSNSGSSSFTGLSINDFVGATRFYDEGYNGSRAVATIVEAGSIWNGHESLGHVSNFFDATETFLANGVDSGQLGEFDRHATWTGQVLGGRTDVNSEFQRGIAYGADLWSGAIATQYGDGSETFSLEFTFNRGFAFTEA